MDARNQEIVEECIELLRDGRSISECLERYPEEAAALEPFLRSAISIRSDLATDLPVSTRSRMRGLVLAEWDRQHQPTSWNWHLPSLFPALFPGLSLFPKWAVAATFLVVALALGGLGTNTAAANTVPGDILYPVKEIREAAQLWFTRSPEAKVEMYTSLVKERVQEVSKIAARQQADLNAISDALVRMEGHLAALKIVVDDKLTDLGAEDVDPGFVEALQKSTSEQDTAGGLLEMALNEVPADALPSLRIALNALFQAQERVDSALETVGHSGFND